MLDSTKQFRFAAAGVQIVTPVAAEETLLETLGLLVVNTTTVITRIHTTLCSDRMPAVYLQTARAVIHHPSNPHTCISLEVHLILNSGSQKSYISKHAQDLLKLEGTGQQSLTIATFGSNKGSEKVCPIVSVSVCLRG